MKRWLGLALAFVLMLGIFPASAFAAGSIMNILPYISQNPDWKYVESFYDGYAHVEFYDGTTGYIDPYGEFYAQKPAQPFDMSDFQTSEAPVSMNRGDEYLLVDRRGNILLRGLEEANPFSDGVAAVKRDGLWYIIDANTIIQNVQLSNTAYERVLKSNVLEDMGVDRTAVRTLIFESNMNNAPTDAWDASAGANRKVLAYLVNGNELHIAANGGVVAGVDLRGMFAGCSGLETVRFAGNLDTSETQYVAGMFGGCNSIREIDTDALDLSNARDADRIFDSGEAPAPEVTEVPVPEVTEVPVPEVTEAPAPVYSAPPDDSGSEEVSVHRSGVLMGEKKGAMGVSEYVFDTWIKREEVTKIVFLDSLNSFSEGDADVSLEEDGSVRAKIENGVLSIGADGGVRAPEDSSWLFSGYNQLRSIEFNGAFSTEGVIIMDEMLSHNPQLTELDLGFFDTSAVVSMTSIFDGNYGLKTVDMASFDTSAVISMNGMFANCGALEFVDISSLELENVADMSCMFFGCAMLEELKINDEAPENCNLYGFFGNNETSGTTWDQLFIDTGTADEGGRYVYVRLAKGDKNINVKLVQQALKNMGYLRDKADGIYGDNTANAVSNYQAEHNHDVTGEVNGAMYKELYDYLGPDLAKEIAEAAKAANSSRSSGSDKKKPSSNSGSKKPSSNSGESTGSAGSSNSGSSDADEERRPETTKKPA